MSKVTLRLSFNGRIDDLRQIDENLITKCSKTIREALERDANGSKVVILVGSAPGPLNHVLNLIIKDGSRVYVHAYKQPFEHAVMLWEACQVLQVEPKQSQVEGFIIQHVAHHKVTPREMMAVYRAFAGKESKAIRTMVHQLAWSFNHGEYEAEEAADLQMAARGAPDLHNAVDNRIKELAQRQTSYNERATKEARRDARESQTADSSNISQKVREYKEDRFYEESHGLRPASSDTVAWALKEKPGSFYMGPPLRSLRRNLKKQVKAGVREEGEQGAAGDHAGVE